MEGKMFFQQITRSQFMAKSRVSSCCYRYHGKMQKSVVTLFSNATTDFLMFCLS